MPSARAAVLSLDAYGTLFAGGSDAFVALVRREAAARALDADALLARREDLVRRHDAARAPLLRDRDRRILRDLFGPAFDVEPALDALAIAYSTVEVYPDARRLLASLPGRVRWGVVSNADDDVMRALLDEHGLRPHFLVTSGKVGAAKPHPDIWRAVVKETRVPAERILHAGDSWVADVEGAKRAGLLAAWVRRPGGLPRPAVSPVEPDLVVDDLTRLASVLGGDGTPTRGGAV